jgi:hypothetical protein
MFWEKCNSNDIVCEQNKQEENNEQIRRCMYLLP